MTEVNLTILISLLKTLPEPFDALMISRVYNSQEGTRLNWHVFSASLENLRMAGIIVIARMEGVYIGYRFNS
jgi:hypothetical protein